jgi:predicted amidohydrolase YtcJ
MRFSFFVFVLVIAGFSSCMKGQHVDLIIHNAKIHSMDEQNHEYQAMAIRDGKIVELGPDRQIMNKYSADEYVDAESKDVFPGLTDAHGHIMSYARMKLSVDLLGTTSMADLKVRTEKYDQKNNLPFIVGRGWDQTIFPAGEIINNDQLNQLFPNKPVLLHRIDGHAALANDKALKLAGIGPETNIDGGLIEVKDGKCTGLLLDNAITKVSEKMPDFKPSSIRKAILEVQQDLLQFGITGVHEAGVDYADLQMLHSLSTSGQMHLDLYVMLFPTEKNIQFAQKKGIINEAHFSVRSFKVMGDGALGSHGALLKKAYSDDQSTRGLLTTKMEEMQRIALLAKKLGYQLNIHAIGDSTNRIVLNLIKEIAAKTPDHRWRIEHAQVIDPADLALFAQTGAIPSVQPIHAVSDRHWAAKRLGLNRLKGAYAYRSLLEQTGMIVLGTDFPVEYYNPFLTIQAAVYRTNAENEPIGGFLNEEAITDEACLKGMTLWPAIASFQEERLGSLEKGKDATFVILSFPFKIQKEFVSNYAHQVYIAGKRRYSAE